MKRILTIMAMAALLALAPAALGQGVLINLPPITNSQGQPIAGVTVSVFTASGQAPALICGTPVTVYKDAALSIPFSSLVTDGFGNFPFYISPGSNPYGYTVGGQNTNSTTCYGFNAVAPAGSSPTFTSVTTTTLTAGSVNKVITVDGVTYTGAQAIQSALQACAGAATCEVDARNTSIGTQTFTVNPNSGLNMPITLRTAKYGGGCDVQWDHSAIFVDFPSHFRWEMDGTTVCNSTGSTGVGINQASTVLGANCFFCSRLYSTTGTISSGSASLTVASAANLNPGAIILVVGALGGNSNQQTTTNGATGTGSSFVVTSLTGWDNTGSKTNYLQVESEQISCTMSGQVANTFTGCTRGINGTTVVSHLNGVNVQATANIVGRVLAVSGTTVTIDTKATTSVANAQVYFGVTDAIIDGDGTFDGQQTIATTTRFLAGTLFTLAGNVTIGPGITYKRWDFFGVGLFATWDYWILARHYEGGGKPPLALGEDIAIFESSSYGHIGSASHSQGVDITGAAGGDIGVFQDDRSLNTTIFDGACIGNTGEIGAIVGYTDGIIVQSTSKNTHFKVPYVKINAAGGGNALEVNYDGDWTSNVIPTGILLEFGAVDGTGGGALVTTGFTGTGNNRLIGGIVVGGTVGCLVGDYCEYVTGGSRVAVGKDDHANYTRSGGSTSSPDIYGDGTDPLVIGGKSDGSGSVSFGATTTVRAPGGFDSGIIGKRSGGAFGSPDIFGDGTNALVIGGKVDGTGQIILSPLVNFHSTINAYNNISLTGNGISTVQASTGAVVTGSATSISATSLCSTTQCPAGTYLVHAYLDITSACATTGGYIVWLGYTDDGGAKAGSSTTTFIPINGAGTTPSTGSLALSATTNYGQGTAVVRTTGAATGGLGSINYGTTASACGSGGPMVGKLYLDVTRLE